MNKDPVEWNDGMLLYGFVQNSPATVIDLYGLSSVQRPTEDSRAQSKIDFSLARIVISSGQLDIVDATGNNISLAISQTRYVIARFVVMNRQYRCCANGVVCELEDYDGVLDGSESSWQVAHRIMVCVLKSLGFNRRSLKMLNRLNERGEELKGERYKFTNDRQYQRDTWRDMQAVEEGYNTDGTRCYERFIPPECSLRTQPQ